MSKISIGRARITLEIQKLDHIIGPPVRPLASLPLLSQASQMVWDVDLFSKKISMCLRVERDYIQLNTNDNKELADNNWRSNLCVHK